MSHYHLIAVSDLMFHVATITLGSLSDETGHRKELLVEYKPANIKGSTKYTASARYVVTVDSKIVYKTQYLDLAVNFYNDIDLDNIF